MKQVGQTVKDLANKENEGTFPAGEHIVYGLEANGVGITKGQLSEEVQAAVETARQAIIDGEITVENTVK